MEQRIKSLLWMLMAVLALGVQTAWSGTGENGNTLSLPYVAVGGAPDGWHLLTLLFLKNTSGEPDSGTIEFFDNDGQSLPVALNGHAELSAESTWTIPAGESTLFILTHPGEVPRAGWLQMNLSEKSALHVTTIVRFYNSRSLIAEAGVQASPKHSRLSPYYMTASAREIPPGNDKGIVNRSRWETPNRWVCGCLAISFSRSRHYPASFSSAPSPIQREVL